MIVRELYLSGDRVTVRELYLSDDRVIVLLC